MLEAIFELFVPLVIAFMIDRGIGQADTEAVLKSALLLFVLAVIGLTCAITAQYYAAKAAIGAATAIRHRLFAHLQSFSYSRIDEVGCDTMITRMTSDINLVQTGINMALRLFLRSPFIVFGAMIMAFTIDFDGALIFTVTIPLLTLVVYGIMLWTMPMYRAVQAGLDSILRRTRENLSGIRVVRAFGAEHSEIQAFGQESDELNNRQLRVGRISALTNPVTFIVVNAATLVLLYTGAVKVDEGILTRGQVVALVNYMSQILVELIKLANLIVTISKAMSGSARVQQLLDTPPEMGTEITEADRIAQASDAHAGREEKAAILQLIDASLSYNGGDEALSHISLTVHEGETIGIIGGTGSGKTSLVNLICGFYMPTEGQVYIMSRESHHWEEKSLREEIGLVPQKSVLFSGTVAENIRWGNSQASDEELIEALRMASAWDFLEEKEGIDTKVEQGGRNFSGGQRQRLTIARALIRRPKILILDDSTSALDYATDLKVRQAIGSMGSDSYRPTVLIVSQRPSSIMSADQILVLEDGRCAGLGRHEQLMEGCSVYREIYDITMR